MMNFKTTERKRNILRFLFFRSFVGGWVGSHPLIKSHEIFYFTFSVSD